jgi:5-methylcytosine-specific restriction endonuclease McrA
VPADPYASRGYRLARLVVLVRDQYQCQIRGPGCQRLATTADHIVPLAAGGTHAAENLRAACLHCNSAGGGRISAARRGGRVVGRQSRRW